MRESYQILLREEKPPKGYPHIHNLLVSPSPDPSPSLLLLFFKFIESGTMVRIDFYMRQLFISCGFFDEAIGCIL
jgi:hypothetical protein